VKEESIVEERKLGVRWLKDQEERQDWDDDLGKEDVTKNEVTQRSKNSSLYGIYVACITQYVPLM
jgi:hypothetical protein